MASGDLLLAWGALGGNPPSSNHAPFSTRNSRPILRFDSATEWATLLHIESLPTNYSGGGLTLEIDWMGVPTSGAVVWGGSIERAQGGGTDQDSDSFATEQTSAAVTTNAASGVKVTSTITFSAGANMDNLAAAEPGWIKLARKVANAGDDMAGDAQFCEARLLET